MTNTFDCNAPGSDPLNASNVQDDGGRQGRRRSPRLIEKEAKGMNATIASPPSPQLNKKERNSGIASSPHLNRSLPVALEGPKSTTTSKLYPSINKSVKVYIRRSLLRNEYFFSFRF